MKQKDNTDCKICYQIKCRQCHWIATEEDVILIQQGKLTACPHCGWKPPTQAIL